MQLVPRKRTFIFLLFVAAFVVASLSAQTITAATSTEFKPKYPGVESNDLLPETQFQIHEPGHAGMIWWIPTEFWQVAAESHGRPMSADFKSLDEYTTVAVFFAKVGSLGNFDFATAQDLRKGLVLRDSEGNEYLPLEEVSSTATSLKGILKPMLAGVMGKLGENMEIIYFPGLNKKGQRIASATTKSQFSFVLRNTLGVNEHLTQVETPLTALSPKKFCPIDHRKMLASWSYCPWHGVALDVDKPSPPAESPKK